MASRKGKKNIKSFNAELIAHRLGVDPVEIMLKFAAGDWKGLGYDSEVYHLEKADGAVKEVFVISPSMRLEAATASAKYLYSTKQSVTVEGGKEPLKMVLVEYKLDK